MAQVITKPTQKPCCWGFIKLVLLIAGSLIVFVGILWIVFSYVRFSYKTRVWLDDLVTETFVTSNLLPAGLMPYPRYDVVGKNGEKYYFGTIDEFEKETKNDIEARILAVSAVINSYSGKKEYVNLFDPDNRYSFLVNGMGLMVGFRSDSLTVSVGRRSSVSKKPLEIIGLNPKYNIRKSDIVRVTIDDEGKTEIVWYGSKLWRY